jgi:hypothetical protein
MFVVIRTQWRSPGPKAGGHSHDRRRRPRGPPPPHLEGQPARARYILGRLTTHARRIRAVPFGTYPPFHACSSQGCWDARSRAGNELKRRERASRANAPRAKVSNEAGLLLLALLRALLCLLRLLGTLLRSHGSVPFLRFGGSLLLPFRFHCCRLGLLRGPLALGARW